VPLQDQCGGKFKTFGAVARIFAGFPDEDGDFPAAIAQRR
jgi:hypothetical protein